MRKFSVSLPVSAMIVKQSKNFTTAKILKKVCKKLFVTVTILSPNLLLNDCCFKIIVDTRKITENFHMTKVTFLHHFCRWALTLYYSNSWAHCCICSTYVTLRHHVDVKTSLALPYVHIGAFMFTNTWRHFQTCARTGWEKEPQRPAFTCKTCSTFEPRHWSTRLNTLIC